ncbi:MAG: tetratricopeptide repeat protein [Rhodospirillaceae bacterium]|nr:tetratricopeptide repeat protein [Rhodospirillaceae bacterium]
MATETSAPPDQRLSQAQACYHAGKIEDGLALCRQILVDVPNDAEALHLMGLICHRGGDSDSAVGLIRQAISINASNAGYHSNLGVMLRALGRNEEAVAVLRRAIEINPELADSHYNLANVLKVLRDLKEAESHYKKAIEISPNFANAHNNLGQLYKDQAKMDASIEAHRQSLIADPASAMTHSNLGMLLRQAGHLTEALSHYGIALALAPKDSLRVDSVVSLPTFNKSVEEIQQVRRGLVRSLTALHRQDLKIDDPAKDLNTTTFFLAYHGEDDREVQQILASLYRKICPGLDYQAPHCTTPTKPEPGARIKVGFVSTFLRNHTIGRLYRGLIANLDRDKFHVSVFVPPQATDPVFKAITESADEAVALPENIQAAQQTIAQRQLDAVVFPDIGMVLQTYFLAFARLAPVQCVCWGHPDTTGVNTIDYFVSSELLEPEGAEEHYSEKLHKLSTLPTYYYKPEEPKKPKTRSDFGFDAKANLYLCPQTLFKFHPDFYPMLADILKKDKKGVLVMVDGQFKNWGVQVKASLQAHGKGLARRIHFVPPQQHEDFLSLILLADVMLDTPHFSGGNTNYEAFAFGTPVVTLPGTFMRGRVTQALYSKMGVADCIAETPEDYVRIAVELGTSKKIRAAVKKKILGASDAIYEDIEAVREWERFLEGAVRSGEGGIEAL